ncbi:CD9 antigen [Homalodisca vitripennis]|uniref:CD9 antigen n=1 Tax=Homalodisca vitripennis TaxID=197043 RepID=UPI001EEC172A|nr:CD9 antigen [Homalodisca vitripennis]
MGLTGCYGILKYLVFFVNLVFWITGLTIIVLSIWMLTDPTFYMSMAQDESSYYTGVYLFLVVGTLMFIVGFLGCCGAIKESQCMLVLFFCLLLIILVAEISAGAWAYSNSEQLEQLVQESVKNTVQKEYSVVDSRTQTFDAIQQGLGCCGANGPSDWATSKFNNADQQGINLAVTSPLILHKLPASCCTLPEGSEECQNLKTGIGMPESKDIYSEGCTDKLQNTLRDYMSTVVGIGVAVAIAQCLGLSFSLVLCCAIQQRDRYSAVCIVTGLHR